MTLSVIISVWKRPLQLSLMLQELNVQAESNNVVLEVIVSDSQSGKEIDDVVSECRSTCLHLKIIHEHTKNILACKRNFGTLLSTGTHLIYLDDDCVPAENFLKIIISNISKYDDNTILCGEIRFEPHEIESSNYYRYRDSLHPSFSQTFAIEMNAWTFVAMNNVIPKKLILETGIAYNENFVGYGCEDHEFGWQIVSNNIKIVASDNAIIHHEYNGSIRSYAKKIQVTARDAMFVLRSACPEIFQSNKKLRAIEWMFNKQNILGRIVKACLFNNIFFNAALNYLEKTDRNNKRYCPKLYRYVLISAYIQGINERGTVKQSDLLKNWYI